MSKEHENLFEFEEISQQCGFKDHQDFQHSASVSTGIIKKKVVQGGEKKV